MRAQRFRSQRCHVAAARAPRGSRRPLVQPETLPPLPAGGGGSAAAARGRRFCGRENSWCQLAGDHGAGRECGKNVIPRVRVPQAVLPPRLRDNAWRGFACTLSRAGAPAAFTYPGGWPQTGDGSQSCGFRHGRLRGVKPPRRTRLQCAVGRCPGLDERERGCETGCTLPRLARLFASGAAGQRLTCRRHAF